MKFPLRYRSLCAAGLLCFGACSLAPLAASASDGPQPPAVPGDASNSHPARAHLGETVIIPGPLRSFLRMAGISQEVSRDEVMPLLARSVSLYGYKFERPTEFLVLLNRYVHLAREVQALADPDGTVHVAGCDDASSLVRTLGYRFRGTCGNPTFTLATADPERAFLTIDSGFPLTALERALQKSQPFTFSFPASRVPIFFTQKVWSAAMSSQKQAGTDLLDTLLRDHNVDRLYWALSQCDDETRSALMQSPGLNRLLLLAPDFELYGRGIRIHEGKVEVPGGSRREWQDLVDANPDSPGEFVTQLLTRDHGWLAAYYDVVARLGRTEQSHLLQDSRLKRLYSAYRAAAPRTTAATGVFANNGNLLILFTALRWRENGDLAVPGDLKAWQEIVAEKNRDRHIRTRRIHCCDNSEQLLEALVSYSQVEGDNSPVELFLTLSAIDAGRPDGRHLSADTLKRVADKFFEFNRWFPIFAEFPSLDDSSIAEFLNAASHINAISNPALRANALGAFQAEVGLWQIFGRQGEIPIEKQNSSWLATVQPFKNVSSSIQLFDAARSALESISLASIGKKEISEEEMIDLLAGPRQDNQDGRRVHQELAQRIRSVMDDQRLASLDTLFGLYDGLNALAHGEKIGSNLLPLADSLREFEMPRPIFSEGERTTWSPMVYTSRHAELQVRTDLAKIIQSPASPSQLESARGQLTPFLRDTLVGLNYAYYEPPGAEVLHNNPLFVRSHDFSSMSILGIQNIWETPNLIGVGATAGGGAYLVGSLADLPYALAKTEGALISPKNVQALIWEQTVPDLLVGAVLPRWWNMTREELHAADLYQRAGEELFAASVSNPQLRTRVLNILSDRLGPERLEAAEQPSEENAAPAAFKMLPSEAFYLSVEFRSKYPGEASNWSKAARELDALSQKNPADTDAKRLSEDFGVPHSAWLGTNSLGLLIVRPPPAFGGIASRLFPQSWESNNLYWARLADEMGYSPAMLNILVPALTRRMIVNIFASNIDDWPALFRAMQETGDEFREGKITVVGASTIARN